MLKPKKCKYRRCRKLFMPTTYYQKFDTDACRYADRNSKRPTKRPRKRARNTTSEEAP
jgi:hypothetical protein